jgi:hypothetical protein
MGNLLDQLGSVAAPFAPKQFDTARLEDFPTVNPLQARQEIGTFGGRSRLRWDLPGDHPFALRDLDLLALLQEVFNMRKSISKVPNRHRPHVMHYRITTAPHRAPPALSVPRSRDREKAIAGGGCFS